MMNCVICGQPLIGGLDTYGDVQEPLCQACFFEHGVGSEMSEPWYGLAPHHHDVSLTGSIIGSTVMDEVPEPDEDGDIVLPGNLLFTPDPDAPGLGTYQWR